MLGKLSSAIAALAFGLAVATVGPAGAAETVKIAALYNLTGGMSSIDAPSLNGAKLMAKLVNQAGGVLGGKKIEIIAIDTKTDLRETAKAAKKALSMDIIAGIGYGDTAFVMAAAPRFQEKGIPFVTSGATHPMLPTWVGDYMFMTAFGDDDQSFAIADYTYDKLGARRIFLWTDQSMDFTKALSKFFSERFATRGGDIMQQDSFMMGDTDFSAQIARLQSANSKPDAVFISAFPGEAGLSVKQIRESGLRMPIVSGDGFDTELVVSVPGPKLANDVYFSTHTYRADDRREVTDFIAAYQKEYGRDPENAFAPLGFDAVGLIVNALTNANSAEPAKLRDALAATRGYKAVTGEISYTRANMVPPKPVAIVGVQEGKFKLLETWNPK